MNHLLVGTIFFHDTVCQQCVRVCQISNKKWLFLFWFLLYTPISSTTGLKCVNHKTANITDVISLFSSALYFLSPHFLLILLLFVYYSISFFFFFELFILKVNILWLFRIHLHDLEPLSTVQRRPLQVISSFIDWVSNS